IDRCLPGWDGKLSYLVIWLDPVSIDLEDPQGSRAVFDLQSNQVSSSLAKTFIEVGRNVEILVVAGAAGTFNLNIGDVQASAPGSNGAIAAPAGLGVGGQYFSAQGFFATTIGFLQSAATPFEPFADFAGGAYLGLHASLSSYLAPLGVEVPSITMGGNVFAPV